jgi:hypothetical protein
MILFSDKTDPTQRLQPPGSQLGKLTRVEGWRQCPLDERVPVKGVGPLALLYIPIILDHVYNLLCPGGA